MWPYWVGLAVSILVLVAGLIFIAKKWGTGEGEAVVTLPFNIKIENMTHAMVIFVAGAVGGALCISQLATAAKEKEEAAQSRRLVQTALIEEIKDWPSPPRASDLATERDFLGWFAGFLGVFYESQIIVNEGADDGISEGDYFATVTDPKLAEDLPIERIGNLQDELTSILRVIRVYPSTVCGTAPRICLWSAP